MDLGLKNKVIIVTGGSKGIGNAISNILAEEGAIPFIVGRTENDVKDAVAQIKQNGGMASYAIAELTNPDECKNAINLVVKEFGKIDGLVNNAGLNDGVSLENGSYEEFVRSLSRNLTHYYLMIEYAVPFLKKSLGAVVNIGSKTAETGQGGTSGYAAANGGRNALTQQMAAELLDSGIRVNGVIVAECYTPQYQRWIKQFPNSEELLKMIEDKVPLEKRMTTPEEIANMTVFLLSNRSKYINGQLLYVDGGYVHLDRAIR